MTVKSIGKAGSTFFYSWLKLSKEGLGPFFSKFCPRMTFHILETNTMNNTESTLDGRKCVDFLNKIKSASPRGWLWLPGDSPHGKDGGISWLCLPRFTFPWRFLPHLTGAPTGQESCNPSPPCENFASTSSLEELASISLRVSVSYFTLSLSDSPFFSFTWNT